MGEKSGVLRLVLIAGFALLIFWGGPKLGLWGSDNKPQSVPEEKYVDAPGFAPDTVDGKGGDKPAEGELCKIDGKRFDALLSSRGAALKNFHLEGGKYEGMDLSTTPDQERWRSLRTLFRGPEGNDQLPFDRFNWKLASQDGKSCTFEFQEENVAKITKVISATDLQFVTIACLGALGWGADKLFQLLARSVFRCYANPTAMA